MPKFKAKDVDPTSHKGYVLGLKPKTQKNVGPVGETQFGMFRRYAPVHVQPPRFDTGNKTVMLETADGLEAVPKIEVSQFRIGYHLTNAQLLAAPKPVRAVKPRFVAVYGADAFPGRDAGTSGAYKVYKGTTYVRLPEHMRPKS